MLVSCFKKLCLYINGLNMFTAYFLRTGLLDSLKVAFENKKDRYYNNIFIGLFMIVFIRGIVCL